MSATVLVLIEHDRGAIEEASMQALEFALQLVEQRAVDAVEAAVVGDISGNVVDLIASVDGLSRVYSIDHEVFSDYAPEAIGDAVAQLRGHVDARYVVATGTDRGNEVLAHVAAVCNLNFVSNVIEFHADGDRGADGSATGQPATLKRIRWGGSLLETATVRAPSVVMSVAPHVFSAPGIGHGHAEIESFQPVLDASASRTRVVDRITLASGITLQTAPVVVSGGRGVGSAEGFSALEQLASLLGGAVGCSRVVTNQGWRPHSDQVGQTGKRVAPELYIACGISGAIQHWIGMQAARRILAINLDADAPMVTRADYAVIGDLHEIVPAIVAELQRRRS